MTEVVITYCDPPPPSFRRVRRPCKPKRGRFKKKSFTPCFVCGGRVVVSVLRK